MTQSKSEIRKQILKIRNNMSSEERDKSSLYLTDRIISDQWYYLSKKILLFKSYQSEINTDYLIEDALNHKKEVYLPKVIDNDLVFYRIYSISDCKPGYKNILEPESGEKYEYSPDDNTLLIMPGVAFDIYKNRIGYGRGFYDRFLSDKPALINRSIAVGYKCQLLDNIPSEENDIKPYRIMCV